MSQLFVVLIIASLFAFGCSSNSDKPKPNRPPAEREGLPYGVAKFKDGDNTCYIYYSDSISCVKGE